MSRLCSYRLERVAKRQGGSFVLDIPALDVFRGKIFCLLGPTGAGKTTLLRLLSGLEPYHQGLISFQGHTLNGNFSLSVQRRITMVHQQPILLTGSVRWNVGYGLRIRRAEETTRVDQVLRRLDLHPIASQSATTLSGGQGQLVALARAMVLDTDVLLLDEPTANLDPARVALVEEAIAEYRQERQVTVVWATHNLFQARRVADRVGLLLNGKTVEVCETEDFFERPQDPRTRLFVQGKMVY